ncbi:MAG: DUF2281 domain-containing protein [Anaerolineae bacterium]|nr:DUF2281 domain-containing protein [Anaerolineae bacterium]
MQRIEVKEAETNLTDLINAAINGENIFIIKDQHQVVQLVPVTLPLRTPKFGSAKGLITISEDFDAPLKDFEDYMP